MRYVGDTVKSSRAIKYRLEEPCDADKLRVIIPVGGQALRLRPLTAEVSKAVIRLLNRPIVEIAMANLARQNVKNFIFGVKGYVNYKSLFDYFGDGRGFSSYYGIEPRVHIKYQPRVDDVGNADSVRINMDYYDITDPVVGVQGDNIFDVDIKELIRFHEQKDAVMTIGVTAVDDVTEYGVAKLDKDMRVMGFVEKPKREEAPSNLINTGVYFLSPKIREIFQEQAVKDMIRAGRLDFGLDFIPYLLKKDYSVYAYPIRGHWYDIGTPKKYLETMQKLLKAEEPWLPKGNRIQANATVWVQGESAESIKRAKEIEEKIRSGKIEVEGSVLIGRHCSIGDGVYIKDSSIDNYTIIGEGSVIENSAIMDRVFIGRGAEIRDSIIGRHAEIMSSDGARSKIMGISVIADDVRVGEGVNLVATKIYPHETIPPKRTMVEEVV